MRKDCGPDDIAEEQLAGWAGKVLREEKPFVQLLTAPAYYEEETLPGVTHGEWRALANVNGALCVIAVTLMRQDSK